MKTHTPDRPDAAEVKQRAAGRWGQIVPALTGIDAELLDGRHHPCPSCGGTDRFSAFRDFAATGGVICRHCHATENADGLATVAHFRGVSFAEAVGLVAEWVGLKQGVAGKPLAAEAPKRRVLEACGSAATLEEVPNEPGESFGTADELIDSLRPQPSRTFDDYRLRDGQPYGMVHRYEATGASKKFFKQSHRQGNGRWVLKAMPRPSILYALHEWAGAAPHEFVVVTEGEGKCDDLRSLGVLATTWPGGGSNPQNADWSELSGRHVVLWPDNDDPGTKAMAAVVDKLVGLPTPPASIRWLAPPKLPDGREMPPKGDATEWVEAGGTIEMLHQLIEGAEVVDLPTVDEPVRRQPHPIDVYPEPVRDYIKEVARAVQVDAAMPATQALAAISAAVGASREVAYSDDWVEKGNLYVGVVGPSGSGKSPSEEKMLAPIRMRDGEFHAINCENQKGHKQSLEIHKIDLDAWRKRVKAGEVCDMPDEPETPPVFRAYVGDITPEALADRLADNPRGLLCLHDELSGLLGGMDKYSNANGAERALYLSAWSGKSITVDRKTGDKRTIYVASPYLSLFGGVQNDLLHSLISEQDVAAGLPQRFLWAMPPVRRRYLADATINKEIEGSYHDLIASLYRLEPEETDFGTSPVRVYLDDESRGIFKAFHDELEDQIVSGSGMLGGVLSKLKSYALRLALLVHCVKERIGEVPFGETDTLHADAMTAGVTLARWFANEARRVFSIRGESREDAELRELVEWIEQHGGAATDREIAKGPQAFRKDSAKRAKALKTLEESGVGVWRVSNTRGRQRHEFALVTPLEVTNKTPAALAAEPEAPKSRVLLTSAATPVPESPTTWGFEL